MLVFPTDHNQHKDYYPKHKSNFKSYPDTQKVQALFNNFLDQHSNMIANETDDLAEEILYNLDRKSMSWYQGMYHTLTTIIISLFTLTGPHTSE